MALQLERLRTALAAGMPRRGWKVGINVPEVQQRLRLPHAAVGWLDGQRVLPSGAVLAIAPGARLHVEPELALSLGDRPAVGGSSQAARGCIAWVHPALEVVDYAKPASALDDVLAHAMFHHATVLGPASLPGVARELGSRWPLLRLDGVTRGEPRSDLVPADLGALVAFVAGYLAAFGERLEAGDVVLSGSFTARAVPVGAGQQATAEFGPLGVVAARFAAPEAPRPPPPVR